MSVCMFGYQNAIMAGTVTADSQIATMPATNLQLDQGGTASSWRTVNASGGNLTVTWPAPTLVQVVSFHRTNLSLTATWYITLSRNGNTVANYGSPGNNKPCSIVNGQCVCVFPSAVQADKMVVSLYEPNGNPDGYAYFGLAYAGPVWQPQRNFSYETTTGTAAQVDEIVSMSGVEYPQYRYQQRTAAIDHQSIGLDELPTLRALCVVANRAGNILFIPDPASAAINTDAIFGRMTPGDITNPWGGAQRRQTKMTIKERI